MPSESNATPVCPCCGRALWRIRRSFGDRLLSLVSQRRRYRCQAWDCRWEGTIKMEQPAPPTADSIVPRDTARHAAGK